ncbi:MAG TPA: hypothetical protein VM779_15040 [Thermoanaerobaculia bacterium]|nr:hypothetical protein [Thermoanaerobaculia bacterium]
MNPGTLLLFVITATLVLRSGDRIDVSGPIREENGRIVFRVPGGGLYSLPVEEIDPEATVALEDARRSAEQASVRKLKVSAEERDRLLAELAQNRGGQPPLPQQTLTEALATPTAAARAAERDDEWRWRREARHYEERVRRAQENVQLLESRVADLESQIRGLLSVGFEPRQFSYQTTMLAAVREQIPAARLSVTQAQRAYDQFREDARRQGVLPGWLR